jgi:hypothetical protein
VRRQLMQVYVQKSTNTIFPRTADVLNGGELIHSIAPSSGGNSPSIFN